VGNLGMSELIVVLLIVVLLFGAKRLPEIGEGLGKAIKSLKRGLNSDEDIEVAPKERRVAARSSAEPVEDEIAEAEVTPRRKS
jgi:sec-independent protein translocase protein TatA